MGVGKEGKAGPTLENVIKRLILDLLCVRILF